MRIRNLSKVPQTLAVILAVTLAGSTQAQTVQIAPQLQQDPLVITGTSVGSNTSDCGYISAVPNQTIEVTQQFPYLRFSVQSDGDPTLLIDGPGGRFCILADRAAGEKPEISGLWTVGTYSIYIGDRAQGEHSYTLSITQNP